MRRWFDRHFPLVDAPAPRQFIGTHDASSGRAFDAITERDTLITQPVVIDITGPLLHYARLVSPGRLF